MDNSKLTVTVRNKVPEIRYGDYLVSDNKQLRIVFDLDSEWDAYVHKTARFNLDGWQFDIAFTGDTVTLPLLPAYTGELKVGVYAGDLATTTAVSIPVRDSVLAPGDVIPLEDAAEMARVAAEASRVDAENARAAAELLRQSAEFARQFNEDLRNEAETARAVAERTRNENEQDRQAAESARAAAERTRTSAESGRAAAETERGRGENARELAEYRRNLAEQSRQEAEEARAGAEAARDSAETARADAETLRASSERSRASAEGNRAWSESLRAAAENLRASAESARAAQESVRSSAELVREQNEMQRVQNELARNAAELAREQRIAAVIAEFSDYMDRNDVFDVLALIREYGTKAALRMFCEANAPLVGLDTAVLRFFAAAGACVSETYTSTFYLYETSSAPAGTKRDANANLVCVPSTNFTAGRDDYAELPLFACFDCNYTIDGTTLEPVISAIKGVYGNFSSAPASSFVGVLQMTGWVRRTTDATTKTVEYAAYKKESGFKPLPEAVRASDNSVRPFVIHAKYAAGLNAQSKLGSFSGAIPAAHRSSADVSCSISHDSQIARWHAVGAQYCGAGLCDYAFLQTMLEIKYANLGSANVMKGCRDYNLSLSAAAAETGVKRVLVTSAQASKLLVGSAVSVGTVNDRANYKAYGTVGYAAIESITDVELDGTPYKAINLDVDSTFDTTLNTKLVTQPWFTGSTDNVRGNDGSPFDNQSGKEPFKLQGIEVMIGASESIADTLITWQSGRFAAYTERLSSSITQAAPSANAESIALLDPIASLQFVAELDPSADQEGYLFASAVGASSTTGYCASQRRAAVESGSRQLLTFGSLIGSAAAGLAYLSEYDTNLKSPMEVCRACGTGGNRGVYTESIGTLG